MDAFELAIVEKAERLGKLEKDFLKHEYESAQASREEDLEAWFEKACDICSEAFHLKNELLMDLRDKTSLVIHNPVAKRVLDKIRRGESFYSASFHTALAEEVNKRRKTRRDHLPVSVSD